MAKRKHWTQLSQKRRPEGRAIRDDEFGTTWARGGRAFHLEGKGFSFLGFTDPKTKIRRGIFNGTKEFAEELKRLGFNRVKFNASIRERDVKRDYKFKKGTTKEGFIFNRPVYRLKK